MPVGEVREISRFSQATQLIGDSDFAPGEYFSGQRRFCVGVTKCGNAHLKRVIVEAVWAYRFRPWLGGYLLKRQAGLSEDVEEIAWKAQHRLHARYRTLLVQGKNKPQIVTAVGRELPGLVRAIGVNVDTRMHEQKQLAA